MSVRARSARSVCRAAMACAALTLANVAAVSLSPAAEANTTRPVPPFSEVTNTGGQTTHVDTGDLNGDGIPDTVLGTANGATVEVRLTQPDGTAGERVTYPVDVNSDLQTPVQLADVTGDGNLDILAAATYAQKVYRLTGNGDGTFENAMLVYSSTAPGDPVAGIGAGDLNGDGLLDILIGSTPGVWLAGLGGGSFGAPQPLDMGNQPSRIIVTDMNQDGSVDIVASSWSTLEVLYGNGDGTFQGRQDWGAGAAGRSDAVVGDFNADGWLDMAQSSSGNQLVVFYSNAGAFSYENRFQTSGGQSYGIAEADFDHDGRLDLVVGDYGSGSLRFFRNELSGFSPWATLQVTGGPFGVATSDFDRNGEPDVVFDRYSGGGEGRLINTGSTDHRGPTVYSFRDSQPNSSGYYRGPVTFTFLCFDDSGVASCPDPVTFSANGTDQKAEVRAFDTLGNITYYYTPEINIDTEAPALTATPRRPADVNGLYTSPVTFDISCSDTLSGVSAVTCPQPVEFSTDGAAQRQQISARDNADNTGTLDLGPITVDLQAPTATFATSDGSLRPPGGTIGGTAYDTSAGVATVKVTFTPTTGNPTVRRVTCPAAPGKCGWSVVAPSPLIPTTYDVAVIATDYAGRSSTTSHITAYVL